MQRRSFAGFAWYILPAILYAVAIFIGGSVPQLPDTGVEFTYQDKVLHFVAFGGLEVFIWRALCYSAPERGFRWLAVWSCVSTSAIGALLELWQGLLPTRDLEFLDWVADTLGALLAWLVLRRSAKKASAGTAHEVG